MASNAPNQPTVQFEVYKGDALIHSASLTDQSITVGSGDSALLVVADAGLKELHAVLNVEDNGTITVMGLEPGLTVNVEAASATLNSGDTFNIGDLRFKVSMVAARLRLQRLNSRTTTRTSSHARRFSRTSWSS